MDQHQHQHQHLSQTQITKRLAELELTPALFSVLDVLDDDDEGWNPSELADAAGLGFARTKKTVQALVARGLAEKKWTRFDRQVRVTLTAAGTERAAAARAALGLDRMRDTLDALAEKLFGSARVH